VELLKLSLLHLPAMRPFPGEGAPDSHLEFHACAEWPKVGQNQLFARGVASLLLAKCKTSKLWNPILHWQRPWRTHAIMFAMAANGQQPLLHCGQGRCCLCHCFCFWLWPPAPGGLLNPPSRPEVGKRKRKRKPSGGNAIKMFHTVNASFRYEENKE